MTSQMHHFAHGLGKKKHKHTIDTLITISQSVNFHCFHDWLGANQQLLFLHFSYCHLTGR